MRDADSKLLNDDIGWLRDPPGNVWNVRRTVYFLTMPFDPGLQILARDYIEN